MEEWLRSITEYCVLMMDAMALVVIVLGTIEAFCKGTVTLLSSPASHRNRDVWLRYGRWLVVGLTFQLAADILSTSIAPSWDEIGQLAAIAVIRTFLNYFLDRDLVEIGEQRRADAADNKG